MRTWVIPAALVVGALWVWWMRRRLRSAYLTRLVRMSHGSPRRARTLTLVVQLAAAIVAAVLIAVAVVAQLQWDAAYVRVPLLILVIAFYVPLTALATGRDERTSKQRRVQVRTSVQQRLASAGATHETARAIIGASRPFTYIGAVAFVAAAVLLTWHSVPSA